MKRPRPSLKENLITGVFLVIAAILIWLLMHSFGLAQEKIAVKLKPGRGISALERHTRGQGALGVRRQFRQWHIVEYKNDRALQAKAEALLRHPDVERVELDFKVSTQVIPGDPGWSKLWGLQKIQMPQAWELTTGDTLLMAIVDTHVDKYHPDLQANIYRVVNINPDTAINAHHTHVMGTIAGSANNGIGVAGINWRVRVMCITVLGSGGSGSFFDVMNGILYAIDNGARVVSVSLGGYGDSRMAREIVQYGHSRNVLIVCAAGNNNADTKDFSPANTDGVMAIAASAEDDAKAWFSNWGEKLDIAAPGLNIYSTWPGGGYQYASGTSMATPHVSGVAALVLSRFPRLTSRELIQVLRASADDTGPAGRDNDFGYGRLNAARALQVAAEGVLTPEILGLSSGDTVSGTVTIQGVIGGSGLMSWRLQYGSLAGWTTITSGTTGSFSVSGNSAAFIEGRTNLRLVASDVRGREYAHQLHGIEVDNLDIEISSPYAFASVGPIVVSGKVVAHNGVSVTGYSLFADGIQIATGTVPVEGALGMWNTAGLPDGSEHVLTLRASTGVEVSRKVKIDGDLVAGWPKLLGECPDGCGSTPILTDLDGDGRDDAVMSAGPWLYVNDQKTLLPANIRGLNAADLDGDGRKEVMVIAGDVLYVFTPEGQPHPAWTNQTVFSSVPAVADLDGDRKAEMIFCGVKNNANALRAVNLWGVEVPGFPRNPTTFGNYAVQGEYIVAAVNQTVAMLDNAGRDLWSYTTQQPLTFSTPTFVQFGDRLGVAAVANETGGGGGGQAMLFEWDIAGSIQHISDLPNEGSGTTVPEISARPGSYYVSVGNYVKEYGESGFIRDWGIGDWNLVTSASLTDGLWYSEGDGQVIQLASEGSVGFRKRGVARYSYSPIVGRSEVLYVKNPEFGCRMDGCFADPTVVAFKWKIPVQGSTWSQYRHNSRQSGLSAAIAPPPPVRVSYNCVDYNCIDPGDGTGQYLSLQECQAACQEPPPVEPPTVMITYPADGQIVERRSTVTIQVITTNTTTLTITVNGTVLSGNTWKVPGAPNKTYTIKAGGTRGNMTSIDEVGVTSGR